MFDLSIQEATLIQRKTEEIKKKLDEEFIKYSPSDKNINEEGTVHHLAEADHQTVSTDCKTPAY